MYQYYRPGLLLKGLKQVGKDERDQMCINTPYSEREGRIYYKVLSPLQWNLMISQAEQHLTNHIIWISATL